MHVSPIVLVAEANSDARRRLLSCLYGLECEILEAGDGDELERRLLREHPVKLVITSSQLPVQSGIQILARSRARGDRTPFLVVQSVHDPFFRVFVSGSDGSVLSSRVVDSRNLTALAARFLTQ